jgi:hypothetical protein
VDRVPTLPRPPGGRWFSCLPAGYNETETSGPYLRRNVASETEDVRRYIEGVDYPTRAQDLLAAARSSDAPEGVLERLEQLPTNAQFSDPDEVAEELENPQGTGEHGEAPPGEPAEA